MRPLSNACHILYLTDLSAAASPAWQHALMLAQLLHAQIHVVYWADHVGYTWTVPPVDRQPDVDLRTKSAGAMQAGTAAHPDLQQVTAADAATVASGGSGIDLVVLGLASKQSIQMDTLPDLLLWNLECPLWIVGPECRGTGHQSPAIHLPGVFPVAPPQRILYASSLRHDRRAPDLARYFSGIAQGELKLIHVLPSSASEDPEEVLRRDDTFERTGKALAGLMEEDFSVPFQVTVRSAISRAEVILEESSTSDLVVLPVHSISARMLVGSGTIARLIEQIQCPVLIVPEQWTGAPNTTAGT